MKVNLSAINRFFNVLFGALAMLLVALVSAFITMRLAIHGHEVKVPALTGLTLGEAAHQTSSLGLDLKLENRFYSPDTPPGRVLAQSPAPGSTVRREWPVRITESLGPQQVAIPSLLGQSERTASINIRRLSLDLGAVAKITVPGPPGVVIAQTPDPDATGVDRPRVSLLLSSSPSSASDAQDAVDLESPSAIVMPSLAGLTLAGAASRAAAAGLRIVSAEDANVAAAVPPKAPAAQPATTTPSKATSQPAPSGPLTQPANALATVTAQTPPAGHRVLKGDAVHIVLTN